jgi:hypothetical protein
VQIKLKPNSPVWGGVITNIVSLPFTDLGSNSPLPQNIAASASTSAQLLAMILIKRSLEDTTRSPYYRLNKHDQKLLKKVD